MSSKVITFSLSLIGLIACGGGSSTTTSTTTTATTTSTTTSTTSSTSTTTTPTTTEEIDTACLDVPATAHFSGYVFDENGAPIEGASVNLCHDSCRTLPSEADGYFWFENVLACPQAVDVLGMGSDYATPLTIVNFEDKEIVAFDIVMMEQGPTTPTPTTAEEVEILDGFHVTVGIDDLYLLFGDLDQLAGVSVPEEFWLPVEPEGEMLASFYLSPFDAHAEHGLPIRVRNDYGLKEGDVVQVYTAVYGDFEWVYGGTLTAAGDDLVGNAVIHSLSNTILIME